MSFDRISEEIAHFIGLFHLDLEQARLRLEYDAFSLDQDEEARQPQETPDLVVAAPYSLKGFDPDLAYKAAPSKIVAKAAQSFEASGPEVPRVDVLKPPSPRDAPDYAAGETWSVIDWQIPLPAVPNSIVVSILQVSELWDNDLLLVSGETDFIDPQHLIDDFLQFIDLAQALAALGPDGPDVPIVPHMDAAKALADSIAAVAPDGSVGELQLLLHGEAAEGSYLNGKALAPLGTEREGGSDTQFAAQDETQDADGAGDLPNFFDILHEYLAEKFAEDDAEAEADPLEIPPDGTTDSPDSHYAVDPGHEVVTGANLVTNEASITQKWVDAPVIAVAGDAVRLDVVSQVNAMKGTTTSFDGAAVAVSEMLNGVSVEYEAAQDPDAPPPPVESGMFPEDWTVVTIESDLVSVNWVQQYVFATDFDRTEIKITGNDTYIGTGENVIGNAAQIAELGYHYDLILVGGDMITMNVIDQVNVLVDQDTVGGTAAGPVDHHAGDNLQYNRAELKQTGLDEMTAMQDNFRTALKEMAEGRKDLARELAEDARFEGKEALKALHIKGDLVKANIVKQHNFLGDSDQVELMLDDFLAGDGGLRLVTGSNAQLNDARINDIGLDSEVLVGGEAYSDALIHQAKLLDPDAPPTGVGLAPLASEAVAFLADDMLETAPDHDAGSLATGAEHPAATDVMHSIIS